MYKLISEYGNEVVYTEDERKATRLLSLGFRVVDDVPNAPKQTRKVRSNKNGKN